MKTIAALWLGISLSLQVSAQSLMPKPQSIQINNGNYSLSSSSITVSGSSDPLIIKAVKRAEKRIASLTALPAGVKKLAVQVPLKSDLKKEAYSLAVDAKGAKLSAGSVRGVMEGLETLTQLVENKSIPYVNIVDEPRFEWRGLMIDVARHFIPLDVVKRNVDAMAAAKLNILHLHLTDDEGFRIESKKYPKLHELGSDGQYFTQAQMKDLVSYCTDRGIDVYPEFDLPGHSQSFFAGYPELASEKREYKPGPRFKIEAGAKPMNMMSIMQMMNTAPTPTIDPTKEATYAFLEGLLAEMKTIFPFGYFHLGLDESNGVSWKNNPEIVAFMAEKKMANVHELQDYFLQRFDALVKKQGYKSVVWEEAFNAKTPSDIAIQVWKPSMMGPGLAVENIVKQGNTAINSRGFYLDHFMPSYFHLMNKDFTQTSPWKGGEAAMWSEVVDGEVFEGRVWPRTLAIAERLWTNPVTVDLDEFYTRLFAAENYLEKTGLHLNVSKNAVMKAHLPAEKFLNLLTPIKGYKRLMGDMTIPTEQRDKAYRNLRDVLRPDSKEAFVFRMQVKEFLKNGDSKQIAGSLQSMLKAAEEAKKISSIQPLVNSFDTIAPKLIDYLGQKNPEKASALLAEIKAARKPAASLELGIWDELEALVTGTLKDRPENIPLM
jgi:hexosaminidase